MLSFLFWCPLYLNHNISLNFFFILACLELKGLVYTPFLWFREDIFQLNSWFTQIILFVELSRLRNSQAKLNVRYWKNFVFYHLELYNYCQFGEFKVCHFNCLLLIYNQFDEYFCRRILRKLEFWDLYFDLPV
jgi:hypothetical protein